MKAIIQSTLFFFLLGATVTGSIYKLLENPNNESMVKIITFNLVMLALAIAISVIGYYSMKKRSK